MSGEEIKKASMEYGGHSPFNASHFEEGATWAAIKYAAELGTCESKCRQLQIENSKFKAQVESIKKDLDKAIADIDKAYGH